MQLGPAQGDTASTNGYQALAKTQRNGADAARASLDNASYTNPALCNGSAITHFLADFGVVQGWGRVGMGERVRMGKTECHYWIKMVSETGTLEKNEDNRKVP